MAFLGVPIVDDPLYPDVRLGATADEGDFTRPLRLVAASRLVIPLTGHRRGVRLPTVTGGVEAVAISFGVPGSVTVWSTVKEPRSTPSEDVAGSVM